MKAVLKNGTIHPQEPLPADWPEGAELDVTIADSDSDGDALDKWYAELEAGCSRLTEEDSRTLQAAIREVRLEEKSRARREAGLEG